MKFDPEHMKSVYEAHYDRYLAVHLLAEEYQTSTKTIFMELQKHGIIGKGVVTKMSNPGDKKFFYTTKEIQLIKDMHAAGKTWSEISAATGRSVKTLQAKWTQLRKEENGEQPKPKEKKQISPIPEVLKVEPHCYFNSDDIYGYELVLKPKYIRCTDKEAALSFIKQLETLPLSFDYEVYAIKRERITLDGDDND